MGCREILPEDASVDADDYKDEACPKEVPHPPFHGPFWSNPPPDLHRAAIVDSDIAPDEYASDTLVNAEKALNDAIDGPTTSGSSKVSVWDFPPSSEVRIGPPEEGANGVSDLEARSILRGILERDRNCYVCGPETENRHQTWDCPDANNLETEGGRMLKMLYDQRASDEAAMGIEPSGW
jgi:hypothetical protein